MANRNRQQTLAGFETASEEQPTPERVEIGISAEPETPAAGPLSETDLSFLAGKTVYVVDAHSLIYQVFHVLPDMTSPTGQPVGAVYGFTRDILDLLENKQPDFLFCAFDHHGDTFRHTI